MTDNRAEFFRFDSDKLKLTAAISMLIDHIGAILFPNILILRIIGRISFPIFVFFIAEGCRYTKNKRKYFFNLCLFAVITRIVKMIFGDTDDFNVLFTFAIAVTIIFAFQKLADSVREKDGAKPVYPAVLFAAVLFAVWLINRFVVIQYGFWGCVAPFIVYLSDCFKSTDINVLYVKNALLAVALCPIYLVYGGVQSYAYLAVVLLLLYSGQKGSTVPKYFFYVFYPLHLAVLYLLNNLI